MQQTPNQLAATPQAVQPSQSKDGKVTDNDAVVTATKTQETQPVAKSEQPENGGDSFAISSSDQTTLVELLGQETAEKLIDLRSKADEDKKVRPKDLGAVNIAAIPDKAKRSQVHSVSLASLLMMNGANSA